MPVENPEDRTVEVRPLPPSVDEELLSLYFENKRRSGGGPLVSIKKKGDSAVLVFEEAEAAAQVLSKGGHILHNVELSVRKPVPKDRCRLLLQGINPSTNIDMIELYVEKMMGLNTTDYILHPTLGRDCILIHLNQPFSTDFQILSAKISKRTLNGATVMLEEIEQTDSVFVENLHPGTSPDLLMLYFESKGGGQTVKEVTMLSVGTAKVSFESHEALGAVLNRPHKLEGADLVVVPYFDFLHPPQSLTPQDSEGGIQEMDVCNIQTSLPMSVDANSQSSSQMTMELLPACQEVEEEAEEVMKEQMEVNDIQLDNIAIGDPVKLNLFQLGTFKEETEKAHPDVTIQIQDNGVHIAATDGQTFQRIKQSILEYFGKMAETYFTLEPEKAELLSRSDVKERLQQTMNQTPATYMVSDSNVVVTALSQSSADQACNFLKSQLVHFSLPVDSQLESIFCCREWSEFLQALAFSSVKVSGRGENIDVFTLKGMESEIQNAILQFLTTPIERETVISMEPGVLKYIQTHCHQLLADMDQVSIFPVEADHICELKIHGHPVACQVAAEVLQDVVSSVCTKTITINVPGITRYLAEEECIKILNEMEKKFQVYIIINHVPWEPLPDQDIFETAWMQMSHMNFQRDTMQTKHFGAVGQGLLEEAKTVVSSIDDRLVLNSNKLNDFDNMDLYKAEGPTSSKDQDSDVTGARALCHPSDLAEEAQLSLAIQHSMESSQWTPEEQDEQLQKALELSRKMMQHETSSCTDKSPQMGQLQKGINISLESAVKAGSTIELHVFALYNCDLIRVNIAFGKKVSQRQMEKKLEHRILRNMSMYGRKVLEMIKRKHGVEIQVQDTIITVSGFTDFVTGALWDVELLLDKMSNSVSEQEILREVQWVYHHPLSSDTTPYSPDAIVFIENVWRAKLSQIDILLDNQPHTINFEKMKEYNKASGNSVRISRKLINSWDLDGGVSEEEYSLLLNMPERTKVVEKSAEFQNVIKNFYATIQEYHSRIKIIQVEKLMNRLLYNQYKLKKASIMQRGNFSEVEKTLYHGTSESSVKEICIHGFNRSFCGKNATAYGQGVYFAVNSALSVRDQYSPPNADGHKFIFVSKVLTGDYTKGCHSMKTTPLKETGDIPLRYDSVTDNITKPTMFVIFNDTQAFPEYLITCQIIQR